MKIAVFISTAIFASSILGASAFADPAAQNSGKIRFYAGQACKETTLLAEMDASMNSKDCQAVAIKNSLQSASVFSYSVDSFDADGNVTGTLCWEMNGSQLNFTQVCSDVLGNNLTR